MKNKKTCTKIEAARVEIIKIAALILAKEGANALEIATLTGKSRSATERYLRIAKEAGIAAFKGAPKTGGYYLTRKMQSAIK